jgi:hypothetical protein
MQPPDNTEWIWDMTDRLAWRPEIRVLGQSGHDPGVEVDAHDAARGVAVLVEWDCSTNGRVRLGTVQMLGVLVRYLVVVSLRFAEVVKEIEAVMGAPGMADELARPSVALDTIGILEG